MRLLMRRSSSRSPGYGDSASGGMVLTYGVVNGLRGGSSVASLDLKRSLAFKFTVKIPAGYFAISRNTNSSAMKVFDLALPTPEQNLACDEALLDLCEEDGCEEILRFWEHRKHFVVLGYSNNAATEVNLDAARRDGVPVLRRCSGGGAVLQG